MRNSCGARLLGRRHVETLTRCGPIHGDKRVWLAGQEPQSAGISLSGDSPEVVVPSGCCWRLCGRTPTFDQACQHICGETDQSRVRNLAVMSDTGQQARNAFLV